MSAEEVTYIEGLILRIRDYYIPYVRKVKLCFQHCDSSEFELRNDESLVLSN